MKARCAPAPAPVLVLALVLASGCATMKVSTDYDPKGTYTTYKTFEMAGGTPAPNALAQQRIDEALVTALQGKGLQKVESGGDLKVYTHVRMSVEKHIDYDSFGYAGYGYHGYGYAWAAGPTSATVREYPIGTLVIDLVDTKTKKLVWRGTASDYVDENPTPEKREAKAKEAMSRLFANFPPAPGSK